MAERPNIIFLMADDMGYGDLGCYGATKVPTPHMDRLAAEGMRFTDAHSASALCTPSRYAVITGRYCWRSGLKRGVHGGFSLPLIDPARLTVASLLRRNGYRTAAVGKWHLGLEFQAKDGERINPDEWSEEGHVDYTRPILGGPTALGFDTFFGIAGSLDMPPYCHIADDRTCGVPSVEKDVYNPQQRYGLMTPGWQDEEVDLRHMEKAAAFIRQCRDETPDRPFFLYLTPSAPHRPCMVPDAHKGRSQAGPRGDLVTVVDWMAGQVMDQLDRLGIAGETLLIVTSDNGAQPYDVDRNTYGHKSCGDLRGFKSHIWDGGHREPFIARWPGRVPAGSTSDELICLSDLMATCAAIVGDTLPTHAGEDSFDILPVLLGRERTGPVREAVVHHSGGGMFSIRQGAWKLVLGRGHGGFRMPMVPEPSPDDPPGQLYDLADDLGEQHNLWDARPEIVERLTALLRRYVEEGRSRPEGHP